jgi:hypothetical protein
MISSFSEEDDEDLSLGRNPDGKPQLASVAIDNIFIVEWWLQKV